MTYESEEDREFTLRYENDCDPDDPCGQCEACKEDKETQEQEYVTLQLNARDAK